jgi:hypothetical protein
MDVRVLDDRWRWHVVEAILVEASGHGLLPLNEVFSIVSILAVNESPD